MNIQFSKMHGLGNDFVVIDAISQEINLSAEQIRFIADRHFGVGCDQLLLVEKTSLSDVDFRYRIYNSDGGEVEQCGNGARCFARFVREKDLCDKDNIRVETQNGIIELHLDSINAITVDMGMPTFEPAALPMLTKDIDCHHSGKYELAIEMSGEAKKIIFGAVSIGNPHAVILVDDVQTAAVETIGPIFESHSMFPNRVNVGFIQVVDRQNIKLRVFERGVGETNACGSGACAAVVVAQQWALLDEEVQVQLSGGSLLIKHQQTNPVFLIGGADLVFDGQLAL